MMYWLRIICETDLVFFIWTTCKKTLGEHHLKGGSLNNKQKLLKPSHTDKITNIISYMLCA